MRVRLAEMTWREASDAIGRGALVLLPTGATEAHGAHLPLDTDSHQAGEIAERVASRLGAVVAPTLCYGVSNTFEAFAGTISLTIPTYQQMLYEVGAALVRQGFRHVVLLNGNRPNGTSNDAVARRLVDDLDRDHDFVVTAVSYWEPAAAAIHAARHSQPGGMGHGGEFETSFQLHTRPELVRLDEIAGVEPPLVGWDLVAPGEPSRSYTRRPSPETNHSSIFGDPHVASGESGERFVALVVEELVRLLGDTQLSYGQRRAGTDPA